ncbi:MAG TPA: hypothetical protein VMV89_12620, partial [Candidatus Paceibacterota bacterium]|nr:hypothetical protein [Candidatus Paceibacterota bacterium]
ASGSYDFRFRLDADPAGNNILATVFTNAIPVSNGLFSTTIDFGTGWFNGSNYWLEVDVRTNATANYTGLTPLQSLTPTPYAVFASAASNVSGTVSAAQISGAMASANLSGTYGKAVTLNNAGNSFAGNGANLTSLDANNLSSGIVPDARLSANVALLNGNQTFTGANTFSGNAGSFVVNNNYSPINTGLFTGLGLQYYNNSGEGAIMSSFNDGYGFLTFYTKQGLGFPIARQMMIDGYGGVAIDQQGVNNGVINDGTTNGVDLTFGVSSGEGIASKRTAGGNQYGLDFYTDFNNRMAITQAGNVGINTTNPVAQLDVEGTSIYGGIYATTTATNGTGISGEADNGTSAYGVDGYSSGGYGVVGDSLTGSGVYANSAYGSALTIGSGAIHVTGAGIGSSTAVFIQLTSAANDTGNYTAINNPLCNGNPFAILMVTHCYNPHNGTIHTFFNKAFGVFYKGLQWNIYTEDNSTMPTNIAFNVLIIKN